MKPFFLIILVAIGTACCVNKKETPVQNTLPGQVQRSLSKQQLEDIGRIHHVFHEVEPSTLEKTIDKFRREEDPESEIQIWLHMANAYERFTQNPKHTLDHSKRQQAFELILLRSMMTEEEVKEKIRESVLSDKEIEELFSYYTYEPQPLKEEKTETEK